MRNINPCLILICYQAVAEKLAKGEMIKTKWADGKAIKA